MLEKILTKQDCRKCKLCCKFQEDELIDAPTFTETEKNYIINNIEKKVNFIKKGSIYQIMLEKKNNRYVCPLLTSNGCILGDKEPFDCKSWPYYIMKKNNDYVITISNDCPVIKNKSEEELKNYIKEEFLDISKNIIKTCPDMITNYNRNLKILYTINKNEI